MKLSWNHSGSIIDKVRIGRSDSTESYEVLWPTKTFTLTGLTTGLEYGFSVTAIGTNGTESSPQTILATPTHNISCTETAQIDEASGQGTNFELKGNHLITTVGTGNRSIRITDLSDPNQPTQVGTDLSLSTPNATWYPRGLILTENKNYGFFLNSVAKLAVVDVTNVSSPSYGTYVNTLGAPMDLAICGNKLFVAAQSYGLQVFDITTPSTPTLLASKAISNSYPYGVSCFNDHVYVGTGGTNKPSGLYIFEVSESGVITDKGSLVGDSNQWGGRSVSLTEDLLYMAWTNQSKLAIFNTSDKDNIPSPILISDSGDSNTRLSIINNYLFTSKSNGLQILDLFSPSTPQMVFQWTPGSQMHIAKIFTTNEKKYLVASFNTGPIRICELSGF